MRRAQEKLFEGQNLMKSNIGAIGEHTAEVFLAANGCALLARNYACRFGEIDRIMRDNRYIIFAEVKTRAAGAPVSGEEAVDARKQEKLRKTAPLFTSRPGPRLGSARSAQSGVHPSQIAIPASGPMSRGLSPSTSEASGESHSRSAMRSGLSCISASASCPKPMAR